MPKCTACKVKLPDCSQEDSFHLRCNQNGSRWIAEHDAYLANGRAKNHSGIDDESI